MGIQFFRYDTYLIGESTRHVVLLINHGAMHELQLEPRRLTRYDYGANISCIIITTLIIEVSTFP